ncbi:uncharacterized protein FPRO_05387 [Fusarium proliferatum ET1]|uniref:Uncharacterized protein n=1 Tax=Fusarium proliferatum (strain ET1) TaxID=1227346 RepID=A0A1L7VIS6_FUSPR|nr:uncharacterized protein FPRO_05387 [Fusarium proliferatum ET1]CZR40487.1 uncharacterized protein FPRO_05387 [Fusarium proliferatum ET1]
MANHLTSTSVEELSSNGTASKFSIWWFCHRMELPGEFLAMTLLEILGSTELQHRMPCEKCPYSITSISNGRLLISAAGAGESRIVKLLLDMKPIEENLGYLDSAFRRARSKPTGLFPYGNIIAGGENATVLRELLEVGANVNRVDSSGNVAIHIAAPPGHPDIVTVLTERQGAHLDRPNRKGENPLLLASIHGHTAVVAPLLDLSGSDSHRGDEGGRTPLSWAATRRNKALFDLMYRDRNINMNKDDCLGRTPLIWARLQRYSQTARSLLDDPRVLELDPESTPALSTAGIQLPDEYIWDKPMTTLACTKVTGQGDASTSFPSNGIIGLSLLVA